MDGGSGACGADKPHRDHRGDQALHSSPDLSRQDGAADRERQRRSLRVESRQCLEQAGVREGRHSVPGSRRPIRLWTRMDCGGVAPDARRDRDAQRRSFRHPRLHADAEEPLPRSSADLCRRRIGAGAGAGERFWRRVVHQRAAAGRRRGVDRGFAPTQPLGRSLAVRPVGLRHRAGDRSRSAGRPIIAICRSSPTRTAKSVRSRNRTPIRKS